MEKILTKELPSYHSKSLDHLGLVSGICEELEVAKIIDQAIPCHSTHKKVSHGQAVVAMIINGLGFTNKALYLTPKFFNKRPIERLFDGTISAQDLNDDVLGRALDAIFEYNPTELFSLLSAHTVSKLNLTCKTGHLDSTSFHVDGKYNSEEKPDEQAEVIHITHGYSRDLRPELNKIILNMIVENQASIPVFMQSANGNSSDKHDFKAIINEHIDNLQNFTGIEYIVADSALYTYENVKTLSERCFFITRVPIMINEAKAAILKASSEKLTKVDAEYSYYEMQSNYGEKQQRWIVIHSQQAKQRDLKQLNKKLSKISLNEYKHFEKLKKKVYACQTDAQADLEKFKNTCQYSKLAHDTIVEQAHYGKRGKPSKEDKPKNITYHVHGDLIAPIDTARKFSKELGYFILATNELDQQRLSAADVLTEYKGNQKVERGFRFLKSPYFFASSLYLKNVKRIMALMMVMTLCLMVYAALEYKIRQSMKAASMPFPNQLGKPIYNPTSRWIFEYFYGIHALVIDEMKTVILNLNDVQKSLLNLLGHFYQKAYS